MNDLAIGLDLGGTKIEGALVNRQGQVMGTVRQPTPVGAGPAAVVAAMAEIITHLRRQAPAAVRGIGVGSPGQVDDTAGVVRQAANLGWEEVPVRHALLQQIGHGLPIHLQRDSAAELLGEYYFGAGYGAADLVYLGLGTGLGGAALSNGRLIIGHTHTASEIGHLVLDATHGRLCGCGLRGCAETVVSGTGFLAHTQTLLDTTDQPSTLRHMPALTAPAILAAATAGDPLATAALQHTAGWLAQLIANYAIILNPQRIIIGGGFGRAAFGQLAPLIRHALPHLVLASNQRQLELAAAVQLSSAVGAACLVWQAENFFAPNFVQPQNEAVLGDDPPPHTP